MNHPTHTLKAYAGDPHKRMIFCSKCGKEEDEGLSEPCDELYLKFTKIPLDRFKHGE